MVIERTYRSVHWDYLLSLEEDLLRLSRYVDFSSNEDTFSIEIARVLMAAAAEVDVVLRALCSEIAPASSASSIHSYHPIVTSSYPSLQTMQVHVDRYGLVLSPWRDWGADAPPLWWTANNKVKHERSQRFSDANLKNCLNAVAGLFVAVLFRERARAEAGELNPVPQLLRIPGTMSNVMNAHPARYYYRLQ